jgi:hypothetical protein
MRCATCMAVVIGVAGLGGWVLAAEGENAGQQKSKHLEPLCQAVQQLVLKYYPQAIIASSYDKKNDADKIHVDYNTQSFVMRFRGKDGAWQKPTEVRGPYAGGVWCDMVLLKGRYAGDVAGAEEGFTAAGPDYYSRLIAPYSKKLDRHLLVTLRFPGGTPSEFLKRFDALVRDFESYVEKPEPH